ncbi:unnamed protein product [Diamesa hyperborea]
MSDPDESTVVKNDVVAEIQEEKVSLRAAEKENLIISKLIVDCEDELQEQEFRKLEARSDNQKRLLRRISIYSNEINFVMTDMELLKKQRAFLIPARSIRTFSDEYLKLTEDMENLVLKRSMMSIEERQQDLISNQKKVSARVNDVIKRNQDLRSILRTGNWKFETQILNSLLHQPRKQGQDIDNKGNLRKKRIEELQKKISTSQQNLNIRMKENSEKLAYLEKNDYHESVHDYNSIPQMFEWGSEEQDEEIFVI